MQRTDSVIGNTDSAVGFYFSISGKSITDEKAGNYDSVLVLG